MKNPIIDIVIPAFNEENSIGHVLTDIPRALVRHIVVANNASSDNTGAVARSNGAIVVDQPNKGYGNACLKALEWIDNQDVKPDIVVFLDADYSDHPEELPEIIKPIVDENFDLVIGYRSEDLRESGSMQPQQIFGNWLATTLIRLIYNKKYSDLGPFRAITWNGLQKLNMQDRNYGWTVEMQVKAIKQKLRITEIPVSYRKRIGVSKVSGTIKGTILAGYKIIITIVRLWRGR